MSQMVLMIGISQMYLKLNFTIIDNFEIKTVLRILWEEEINLVVWVKIGIIGLQVSSNSYGLLFCSFRWFNYLSMYNNY